MPPPKGVFMSYEWKPKEIDPATGIPYSKLRAARLEKNGVTKKFKSQKELDWAWKNGWYEPKRPETADVITSEPEVVMPKFEGDKWPSRNDIMKMNMTELTALADEKEIPGVDRRWGTFKLRKFIVDFVESIKQGD